MDYNRAFLLHNKLKSLLQNFADSTGLSVTLGRCKWSSGSFTLGPSEFAELKDGVPQGRLIQDWDRAVYYHRLPKDGIGREFAIEGVTYIINGYNRKSKKYKIEATRKHDGTKYKFTPGVVIVGLKNRTDYLRDTLGLTRNTPEEIVLNAAKEQGLVGM